MGLGFLSVKEGEVSWGLTDGEVCRRWYLENMEHSGRPPEPGGLRGVPFPPIPDLPCPLTSPLKQTVR